MSWLAICKNDNRVILPRCTLNAGLIACSDAFLLRNRLDNPTMKASARRLETRNHWSLVFRLGINGESG